MTRSGVISDELWAVIEPVLPAQGHQGRPWRSHRDVLEAICWRYRVGAPWRDLPAEFGPWQTVWKRHFRWSTDGTYEHIFEAVQGNQQENSDEQLAAVLSVDSTNVRAHQHAAGGVRSQNTGGTIEAKTQGAQSNDKKMDNEPPDHAIGLSCGGLTTKIHALTDALVRPVTISQPQ
jgi:transposase